MEVDKNVAQLPRKRGRPKGTRRSEILRVASRLFFERGYHSTTMDDVGHAAGLSGPGVYRHFPSKDEILLSLVDEAADKAEAIIQHIYEIGGSPKEMLDRLVCCEVRQTFEAAEMLSVIATEMRNLQPQSLARVLRRGRINREEYANLISSVRPDLADSEVRTMVLGIKGLINGIVAAPIGLAPDHLERLLIDLVLAVIHAPKCTDAAFMAQHLDERLTKES